MSFARPLPCRPIVSTSIWLALAAAASGQVTIRSVAHSGEKAPGLGDSTFQAGFTVTPRISNNGNVLFQASTYDAVANKSYYSPLFSAAPGGSPTLVAVENQALADGSSYVGGASRFAINDVGQTTIVAPTSNAGTGSKTAILVGTPGNLATVARDGGQANGTDPGINYSLSTVVLPSLNNAGRVAFESGLVLPGQIGPTELALFSGTIANPQPFARKGDAAPGTASGVAYDSFSAPALNDAGAVAYVAALAGASVVVTANGTVGNDSSVYVGSPLAPLLIARTGSTAPGTASGTKYVGFATSAVGRPQVNGNGQVAFTAGLTVSGTNATGGGSGVFLGTVTGDVQPVALPGSAAPGLSVGVTRSSLSASVLSTGGQVAYLAALAGTGVTSANDSAIYVGTAAASTLVAREGTVAPGAADGATFGTFSQVAVNARGQVAFLATLLGTSSVDNNQGLYLYDPTLGLVKIIREGDAFDGLGDGTMLSVRDATNHNNAIDFADRDFNDTSGPLADDGTLVFALSAGSPIGIYTATIPEPATLATLALCGAIVGMRRRRATDRF